MIHPQRLSIFCFTGSKEKKRAAATIAAAQLKLACSAKLADNRITD
jgi:hypothetical protein